MDGRAKSSGQGILPGTSTQGRGTCRKDLKDRPRRRATITAVSTNGIFLCSRKTYDRKITRAAKKRKAKTGSFRSMDASRTGVRTRPNASRRREPGSIAKQGGSCLLFFPLERQEREGNTMVPEKGKPKGRQVSLADAPQDKPDSTDSLVAKAFDSDPKVRMKVAQDLGRIDDPRAIFALIELSSDKEEMVKEAAQRSLGNFKEDADTIVSLEKMLQERKDVKVQPAAPSPASVPVTTQRMAPTIEKLFSHYDTKKRESVKRKLFPSLQKLFGFSKQDWDPMQGLEKIEGSGASQQVTVEMREPEHEHIPKENAPNFPFGQKKDVPQPKDLVELEEEDAEVVSPAPEDEEREIAGEEGQEQGKFYALAHRLATTPGMGKTELKAEQNRLISNFKKEVEIAFKVAFARAKEDGFSSLENLKPGMKNLSFAEMPIASVMEIPYGPKKRPYLRISIWDGKKETPVLVPKERGSGILVSDRLELKKVDVDFLVEKSEIVLVVSKKSKVIVVK